MKNIIIPIVVLVFTACTLTSKPVESPEEKYAIDSIAFFIKEMSFDSIRVKFEDKVSNPECKGDNMVRTYPYIYKGWGFDNITGLFDKDGLLIGVKLSNVEIQGREWGDLERLDRITVEEFGEPMDAHQPPTENMIKEKGEYAYKLFQKSNKCALVTFSWSNGLLHENLYIYRSDKIAQSETHRRIDNDVVELNKLK